ncbi:MAG: ferrochelatase [Janthinobacterium lividum]
MSFIDARDRKTGNPGTAAASVRPGTVGVLLVNLGTPDGTDTKSVRRYLSEFLSDRRVIEANPLFWQPILQGIVLNTRPRKSAANYKRVWNTERDESPLRTYTRGQSEGLQARLAADGIAVEWGMRYGRPTTAGAIDRLIERGCDRILLLPLYPQYSATTTATANDQAFRALLRLRRQPALRTMPSFPDDPDYIEALAASVRNGLAKLDWAPQVLIASFHGLPVEYVQRGDPYSTECARTMDALREALGMTPREFPLTFQSRFGPTRWLGPYTEPKVRKMAAAGIRRIAVITPGFMADCIETLDEIGRELRETFLHAGGEHFATIPCLNDSDLAITLLEKLVRRELSGWI